jgi:lipid-A-disaccharide synthase
MTKRIFIIAGEASGDFLGAQLLQSLQKNNYPLEIYGIGGQQMSSAGLQSLFSMNELSVMGFSEIVPSLVKILKRIKQTKDVIKELKPDLLITIDSPGFCFKIAKFAKKIGIPVLHYVAPSVWAWRPGRAEKLSKKIKIDHLLCLLPFEPPYFTIHGLPATFVGHPITEVKLPDDSNFRKNLNIAKESTLICLLPGSRKNEVKQHLEIFLNTVAKLHLNRRIEVVIPTLPHLVPYIAPLLKNTAIPVKLVTSIEEKWQAFMQSSVALAASGTVSIELAYVGVPQVVAYKVSKITYWLAKLLVKVKYASLVNILNQRMVVPEHLQNQCTPENLAIQLENILSDSSCQRQQRKDSLSAINQLKADRNSNDIAADVVKALLSRKT